MQELSSVGKFQHDVASLFRFNQRHSSIGSYGMSAAAGHSALMFANLTTLPHFSVSSATSFPKSTGDPPAITCPSSAKRCFTFGSVRHALISLLSLLMTSAGVP